MPIHHWDGTRDTTRADHGCLVVSVAHPSPSHPVLIRLCHTDHLCFCSLTFALVILSADPYRALTPPLHMLSPSQSEVALRLRDWTSNYEVTRVAPSIRQVANSGPLSFLRPQGLLCFLDPHHSKCSRQTYLLSASGGILCSPFLIALAVEAGEQIQK